MNDNQLYLQMWRLIAAVICVIVLTVGGCSINKHAVLERMVKNGADPMRASCALFSSESSQTETLCSLIATGARE